ncbi:hypothetical protein J2T22_001618 [Pseudarthrobacter defluvii]|uniref:Uncharacterized protein n=1 Tax=Pseudarthrobacter defluvii TaxID=410837 RepID=A0ABT9UFL6_9MICC|nr:hypothetical protein [Pseudarthrobacter defluvii]MDQ0118440.1 hypothetical protein [Pseudarthrobacter defluvii]
MRNPRLTARIMVKHDPGWLEDIWLRYWANGGSADKFDFDAYLHGLSERNPFDQRILAWALDDLGRRR